MSVTVSIAGTPVSIFSSDTIQLSDREAGTSTAQFTVLDSAGTAIYSQNMVVTVTDSVLGVQFAGYIDSAQPELLNPGPQKKWLIICKDKTWLPSKRQTIQPDFSGTLGGDVVTDLHAKYLAAEGVTANYALRHDKDSTTFGAGTLVNTTGANGDLELSPAGTVATFTDGAVSMTSQVSLCLQGTAVQGANNNLYYRKIWTGSRVIASGDNLYYELFIRGDSPQIMAGVDLIMSDGTTFRDTPIQSDIENGLSPHPGQDLSGVANNQWYTRLIGVGPSIIGKTINLVTVAFEGDSIGLYTAWFRNIQWRTGPTTVALHFFDSTQNTLQSNQTIANNDYTGATLNIVNTYSNIINTVNTHSISSASIVKSSMLSWIATTPSTPGSGQTAVTYQTSIDGGATWQSIANGAAIPNLLPGMSIGGKSLSYRQSLILGNDPTVAPSVTSTTLTVQPAYNATKSDVFASYITNTDFLTGTLNQTLSPASGGITLNGYTRNWDDGILNNQTVYGSGTPSEVIYFHSMQTKATSGDVRARLDFSQNWMNCTMEVDAIIVSGYQLGFEYHTTSWNNTVNSYAYAVMFSTTGITLGKGSNGGGNVYTQLGTATYALTSGTWHHLTVSIYSNTHYISLDGIQYIQFADSSYPNAGIIALRMYNGGSTQLSAYWDNFGVCGNSALTGTWTSPSIALAAATNYGNSVIAWDTAIIPNSTTVAMSTSTDGGSTWQSVTNGGAISTLTLGQSLAAKTLKLQLTISSGSASIQAIIAGISAWIMGQYNATGTRVSPSLSIGAVGRVGSTSITWTATTPTGTTLLVEESLVSATGAWTTATSGAAIPTITSQPVSVSDGFSVSTAGNYTSTNYAGGVNATWTFDTTNSRLTALNGTNGLYIWNQVSAKDTQFDAILSQAANAGLVWRYTDVNNFYFAIIADASSGTNPNTIKLYKRVASVTSGVLATGIIVFPRGTYHAVRVIMSVTSITLYFDGVSVSSITDSGLAGPGSVGLLQSSTTQTNWYSIRGQQFGDDVTGKSVWTRQTLTSTDPTLTPSVTDLVTSVRGQKLMSGIVIGQTNYQYQGSVMKALSDVAQRCPGYTVGITDASELTFQSHSATPADWPLATTNSTIINGQSIGDIQWSTPPTLKKQSPLYRNRAIIVGGMDITSLIPDTRIGDGFTQTWTLAYPVAIAPVITLNSLPATVGIQGTDTGKQFYWQLGSKTIARDVSLTPLQKTDTLYIPYYGQIAVVKQSDNAAQQTALGILEGGTSGIVEIVESVPGLSAVASQALADARVAQYSILSQDWTFTTLRSGLHSGQLLQVFCPEYGLQDVLMLITQVNQRILQGSSDSTTLVYYDVTCTSGANVGDWTVLFI